MVGLAHKSVSVNAYDVEAVVVYLQRLCQDTRVAGPFRL